MSDSTTTFTCRTCNETKDVSERSKSGGNVCRACWATYMREWYRQQSESQKRLICDRVARYREANPTKVLETRLATHAKHATKMTARRCVEAAVKAGVLTVPTACDCCGNPQPSLRDGRRGLHAHHNDHINEPIGVSWLCPKCHAQHDAHKWASKTCDICGREIHGASAMTNHKKHAHQAA